jgi:hypothetical protein
VLLAFGRFSSWWALETGVNAMTASAAHATQTPTVIGIEAQLFVADIRASCDFFVRKLGFAIAFT